MNKKTVLFVTAVTLVTIMAFGVMVFLPSDNVQAAAVERGGPPQDRGNASGTGVPVYDEPIGSGNGQGGNGQGNNGQGTGLINSPVSTPLSEAEAGSIIRAIEEEYGAQALYEGIAAQFGDVAPFTQIARSEMQHANSLIKLAEKYGLSVPAYTGSTATTFASLEEACQAGAAAEIADAALYDELLAVTDHADLIQVYTSLQSASLNSHLPAFEACQ